MGCHRDIIKQRVIDFGKAVAGCFSSLIKRRAIIYLITGACSLARPGSTHRMLVMDNKKTL